MTRGLSAGVGAAALVVLVCGCGAAGPTTAHVSVPSRFAESPSPRMSPSPSQSPLTDKGAVVPSAANTIKVWPIGHTKVPGGDGIAAGVCGPTPGPTVIGFMDPDTAYPRCFVIGPSQQLELVNSTDRFGGPGQSLTVRWADYPTVTIKPGHAVIYVGEFSSYLGGGEHHPVASPLDTTPELYLRDATHTLAGSP